MEKNERKAFERKMKEILKYINRTGNLPDLDDYGKRCLYHCVAENQYVDGIVAQKMISGRIVFDISSDQLTLTKEGLNFCWKPIPWESGANIALSVITAVSIIIAIVQTVG